MQGQPRAQLTPCWVMSQCSKIGLRIIAAGICDQSVSTWHHTKALQGAQFASQLSIAKTIVLT